MAKVAELSMGERFAYQIDEAARALAVSRSTVYELIGKGELELGKLAGRSVIPTASLKAYFDRNYRAAPRAR